MTGSDLLALLPILVLGAFCIVTMLAIAVRRHHAMIAVLSGVSCFLTLCTIPWAASSVPRPVTLLLMVDRFALFGMSLLLLATLVVVVLSYRYLSVHCADHEQFEEFYVLLLVATFGGLVMTASAHFASFFLGLELINVSLHSLTGYLRTRRGPLEAALKYLLLSAASSAFLLFGVALLYFQAGTMAFGEFGATATAQPSTPILWLGGLTLILVAIGFKLGLVPFHLWTPDVYQGAPAPVTAFIATVSKTAAAIVLLRLVVELRVLESAPMSLMLSLLAALSMIAGNFLALLQENIKRLLAYSSIAHFGYVLVALMVGGTFAAEAVVFYLVAYVVMILGAFGVVIVLSTDRSEADSRAHYRGLFWSRPWLAASFTLMLLSLAGIPITVGFLGKLYAVAAGVAAGLWWLVILLIVSSVVGVYYYVTIIITLFDSPAQEAVVPAVAEQPWESPIHVATTLSLGFIVSVLIFLGNYPGPLIDLIRIVVADLVSTALQAKF